MTTRSYQYSWDIEGKGKIEKRGCWFVCFGSDGTKLGSKKGYGAALELLGAEKELAEFRK